MILGYTANQSSDSCATSNASTNSSTYCNPDKGACNTCTCSYLCACNICACNICARNSLSIKSPYTSDTSAYKISFNISYFVSNRRRRRAYCCLQMQGLAGYSILLSIRPEQGPWLDSGRVLSWIESPHWLACPVYWHVSVQQVCH